jgi:polysaccharide export outer membrane protein
MIKRNPTYFLKLIHAFGGSALMLALFASCGTAQKAVYLSDLDTARINQLATADFVEPLIQTDDILSISVQTIDPAASAALNQIQATAGGSTSGFLVDKQGYIEMPMLGKVKVAGLPTTDAKEVIRTQAGKYYKDPTIQVRFANYKITILGEVARPASYTMPNEKVTVFDAISLAGDLTIYGKRENVMLIRNADGGKKDIVRLDLTSSDLISSPYFYLKQNDVLYVEPTKARVAVNNAPRNQMISIGISIVGVLLAIYSRF